MGLTESRQALLPDNIDEKYDFFKEHWSGKYFSSQVISTKWENKPNLSKHVIVKASKLMVEYFNTNKDLISQIKIIEPFAGNGIASGIIYRKLIEYFPDTILKSTDIQDPTDLTDELAHPVEHGINSVDTIEKYKNDGFNVLMMISPPPSHNINMFDPSKEKIMIGYGDYFALKKFFQTESAQLFIFIGELGASDGSLGMYKYLMDNNPNWKLDREYSLEYKEDPYCDGYIERDLYIFKKIK